MTRLLLALSLLVPLLLPRAARAQSEQQELVDRATLAAQDLLNDRDGTQAQRVLKHANAVVICPQVMHAGFIFGGQAGGCVMAARDAAGSWSYPAFYTMGAGSFGLQAGIQDAEIIMMVMTEHGLRSVIDNQIKLGADASVAFINLGGGVEGATTAAAGADIIAFQRTRGLFAGISLSGSLLSAHSEWNQIYYGQPLATQQIVMQMQGRNPAADPLRAILTRYGAQGPAPAAIPLRRPDDMPPADMAPTPLQPVQQQSLPPAGR